MISCLGILRKMVASSTLSALNQKTVLRLSEQVDLLLQQFTTNKDANDEVFSMSILLPDVDYYRNYLLKVRNRAKIFEEQFTTSKAVKNLELQDGSIFPIINKTILYPLLDIIVDIDEIECEYMKHTPLIEHISEMKSIISKPFAVIEQAMQEWLIAEEQKDKLMNSQRPNELQELKSEYERFTKVEVIHQAAVVQMKRDVLLKTYLKPHLIMLRNVVDYIEQNMVHLFKGLDVSVQGEGGGASSENPVTNKYAKDIMFYCNELSKCAKFTEMQWMDWIRLSKYAYEQGIPEGSDVKHPSLNEKGYLTLPVCAEHGHCIMSLQNCIRKLILASDAKQPESATVASVISNSKPILTPTTSSTKSQETDLSRWQHESVSVFLSYDFINSNFLLLMQEAIALQTELGMYGNYIIVIVCACM